MSKPDWRDAPSWANYLAQDRDGRWFWYESKPEIAMDYKWDSDEDHTVAYLSENPDWEETLESRPE